MYYSIVVQILNCKPNLVGKLFNSLLRELEVPGLDVIEQVAALHVLKDNIIEFAVLEQVNEPNNIGMLTHLQDLYLSPLLVYLNLLHILLVHRLYRDFLAILLVRGKFYEAKLTFTKVVLEIIEVKHVRVPNRVP